MCQHPADPLEQRANEHVLKGMDGSQLFVCLGNKSTVQYDMFMSDLC